MKPPAFVSYAREDSEFVLRLAKDLKARGASVWLDQIDIKPGLKWDREIQRALEACEKMLLILSPAAVDSDDVMDELAFALRKRKIVVPVLHRDCDLPYRIERIHYIDMRINGENALPSVLAALGGYESAASSPAVRTSEESIVPPDKLTLPRAGDAMVNSKDGLTYLWIPPGRFLMGCSQGDNECHDNEKPAHQVTITKGFWLGQTPVTQEAYQRVLGKNPSYFKGTRHPVEKVSWNDAKAYCQAVGGRLPTEAEWEYAARAGSPAGRYGQLDSVAWHKGNSGERTHEVGEKPANAFGLYDTLGNVFEWVADWYGDYTIAAAVDPTGPTNGNEPVLRGGCWMNDSWNVRVSFRHGFAPENRADGVGFRCAIRAEMPR